MGATSNPERKMACTTFTLNPKIAFATALLGLSFSMPSLAESPAISLSALQAGGHILYIRHAATEKDYADQVTAVMGDCSTQRTLSHDGWRQAQVLGAAMTMHAIPVGAVYSSQYCRAWATAYVAFGQTVTLDSLNFEPAEDYSAEQIATMRDNLLPLMTTPPPVGFNTVIVGHDDPFEAATGIYPEPQGVTYVLKPDMSVPAGFVVVGHVDPDGWMKLQP
jgi:phosphohistidine phosphatase SixA